MSKVLQHKVVAALPSPLEPDSIYYVRAGAGFDIHVTNGVGVVTAYSLNANLELDGKAANTDPRFTDAREWTAATIPQSEAEAGTASTRRAWTSQRVWQAINAWWQLVTSGFGRNFIAASNEQAARNVLQLGTAATANLTTSSTDSTAGRVLRVGDFGVGGNNPRVNSFDANDLLPGQRRSWSESFTEADAVSVNLPALGGNPTAPRSWHVESMGSESSRAVQYATEVYGIGTVRGRTFTRVNHDSTWHPWEEVCTTGNTLNIGKTAATARTALELTGEWVDLRPHLKPGFYWDPTREGKNSYPRIRKLSCGRVELDGIVSFNETSDPLPVGVFVNVPSEFRPPLTTGGLMFGDTASPLSFGACNWIAIGQVEYSPPGVHGDISVIPLTLTSPAQGGALSINGIYWFT